MLIIFLCLYILLATHTTSLTVHSLVSRTIGSWLSIFVKIRVFCISVYRLFCGRAKTRRYYTRVPERIARMRTNWVYKAHTVSQPELEKVVVSYTYIGVDYICTLLLHYSHVLAKHVIYYHYYIVDYLCKH